MRESPGLPVWKGCGYISAEVWDARSFWSDLATESHLFGLPGCSGLVVWESPGLPVRNECSYICTVIGEARSFCSELVTESYLVVPAVHVDLVFRELRRLLELLLWTDFSCLGIFRTRFVMSSGTNPPATKPAVRTPAVLEPLPGIFDLTLQSDYLYDLDKDIADVIGLRATQPNAAVVKVMSVPNNRCVRVVIPALMVSTRFSFMMWRTRTPLMYQSVSWGAFDWIGIVGSLFAEIWADMLLIFIWTWLSCGGAR